jgi:hypothetical protein
MLLVLNWRNRSVYLFNRRSSDSVRGAWAGPFTAQNAGEWMKQQGVRLGLENVKADDEIIVLAPGESILAHTQEWIGGRVRYVPTMHARSSVGRSMLRSVNTPSYQVRLQVRCLHHDG